MSLTGQIVPPLTLEQLVYLFRERMDDLPGDIVDSDTSWQNDDDGLLWKNREIVGYADEAQQELAHRKPIIDRSITPTITQITTAAQDSHFDYDTRILKIERIKWINGTTGDEYVLEKKDPHWMDDHYPAWDDADVTSNPGVPCYYVDYTDEYRLQLWRRPEVAGTLQMIVHRLPINRLNWTTRNKLLEAQTHHQIDLLDWMQYRAYMKRDAETENPDLAGAHKALFDERIGPRPSAHLQAVRRREARMGRRVKAHFV